MAGRSNAGPALSLEPKGLRVKAPPDMVETEAWWYEDKKGAVVIVECHWTDRNGANRLVGTVQVLIPIASLASYMARQLTTVRQTSGRTVRKPPTKRRSSKKA